MHRVGAIALALLLLACPALGVSSFTTDTPEPSSEPVPVPDFVVGSFATCEDAGFSKITSDSACEIAVNALGFEREHIDAHYLPHGCVLWGQQAFFNEQSTGAPCSDNEKCVCAQPCSDGFHMDDGECKPDKQCNCPHGEPRTGDECEYDGKESCDNCHAHYRHDGDQCIPDFYCQCDHGDGAHGSDCPSQDAHVCTDCHEDGWVVDSVTKQCGRPPVFAQCGGAQKRFDGATSDCSSEGIKKECSVGVHLNEIGTCAQFCNLNGLECVATHVPAGDHDDKEGPCTPHTPADERIVSCTSDKGDWTDRRICQCGPNPPADDVYLDNYAVADKVRFRVRHQHDGGYCAPFGDDDEGEHTINFGHCTQDDQSADDEEQRHLRTFHRVHTCDQSSQTLVVDFDCDATCQHCNQTNAVVGQDRCDGTLTGFTFGRNLAEIQCPTTNERPPELKCLDVTQAGDSSYQGQYCETGATVNGRAVFQHTVLGVSRQLTYDGNNWLLGPQGGTAKYVSNAPFPNVYTGFAFNDFSVNQRIQECINSCSSFECMFCHEEAPSDVYPMPRVHFAGFKNFKSCSIGSYDKFDFGEEDGHTWHRENSHEGHILARSDGEIALFVQDRVYKPWTMIDDSNGDLMINTSDIGNEAYYWNFAPGRLACEAGREPNSDCIDKSKLVLCGTPESRATFGPPTMGACTNQGLNAHCDACTGPSPSECVAVTCNDGFFDLDGQASNGCEATNCGVIPLVHATCTACSGSSVAQCSALSCAFGWLDQDGIVANGCEQRHMDCARMAVIERGVCDACAIDSDDDFVCTSIASCDDGFKPNREARSGCTQDWSQLVSVAHGTCTGGWDDWEKDVVTFHCSSFECDAGWTNDDGNNDSCKRECQEPSTASRCGSCDDSLGCVNPVCKPGYSGSNCQTTSCFDAPNAFCEDGCSGPSFDRPDCNMWQCESGWRTKNPNWEVKPDGCGTPECNSLNHLHKNHAYCESCTGPTPAECSSWQCDDGDWTNEDGDWANGCEKPTCSSRKDHMQCTECSGTEVWECLTHVCDAGWYDNDRNLDNGCESDAPIQCATLPRATCDDCSDTAIQDCLELTCDASWVNADGKMATGCEFNHCPQAVDNAVCTSCDSSDDESCDQVLCDASWYDFNGAASDGCEAQCSAVDHGTCTACSGPSAAQCTAVQCDFSWLDLDGLASTGCEAQCSAAVHGTCTACSGPTATECTALQCDSGWANTNANMVDGCEAEAADAPWTAAPDVEDTNRKSGRDRRVKFRATIQLPDQADKQTKIGQRIARDLQAKLRELFPKLVVRFVDWTFIGFTQQRRLLNSGQWDAQLEFSSTSTDATDTTAAGATDNFRKSLANTDDAKILSDMMAASVSAVDSTAGNSMRVDAQKTSAEVVGAKKISGNSSKSDSAGGFGALIGGIVGVVAVAALIGLFVYLRNKGKTVRNNQKHSQAIAGHEQTPPAPLENSPQHSMTSIEIRSAGSE